MSNMSQNTPNQVLQRTGHLNDGSASSNALPA
jgi:hypothetical protein